MSRPAAGVWLVLLAAVLWSLSGVVLKAPAFDAVPPDAKGLTLAAIRAGFAAVALLPFVRRRDVRWRLTLVPLTLCFAAMNVLFISAMLATTAAAAIFLQYTSTVWACLLGWLFLRERPGRPDAVALTFVVAGIAVIVAGDWGGGSMAGNGLALASGLAYAGVVVCLRSLRDESAIWLTFLNHAVSAAVVLPWVAVPWITTGRLPLGATPLALIAFLGVVQMALPYLVFSRGLRTVSAREASLIVLIEPVLNPLWVLLVWGENAGATTWIGGAVILTGLAVRFLLVSARRRAARPPASRPAGGGEAPPVPRSDPAAVPTPDGAAAG